MRRHDANDDIPYLNKTRLVSALELGVQPAWYVSSEEIIHSEMETRSFHVVLLTAKPDVLQLPKISIMRPLQNRTDKTAKYPMSIAAWAQRLTSELLITRVIFFI
jgi:hypothetical protein